MGVAQGQAGPRVSVRSLVEFLSPTAGRLGGFDILAVRAPHLGTGGELCVSVGVLSEGTGKMGPFLCFAGAAHWTLQSGHLRRPQAPGALHSPRKLLCTQRMHWGASQERALPARRGAETPVPRLVLKPLSSCGGVAWAPTGRQWQCLEPCPGAWGHLPIMLGVQVGTGCGELAPPPLQWGAGWLWLCCHQL